MIKNYIANNIYTKICQQDFNIKGLKLSNLGLTPAGADSGG